MQPAKAGSPASGEVHLPCRLVRQEEKFMNNRYLYIPAKALKDGRFNHNTVRQRWRYAYRSHSFRNGTRLKRRRCRL